MKNKSSLVLLLKKVSLFPVLIFLIALSSCSKDGELAPDFDSGDLTVLFTDTFSLTTGVEIEDSNRTDLAAFNLLGIYNDPVFGPTASSIYTQVTLNGLNVDFGTAVLDSAVITLRYSNSYGDSTPTTVNVFRLTEPMSKSTSYFSNTSLTNDPIPLATKTFIPNITDSIFVGFDSLNRAPHLRIRLDDDFGQSILDAPLTDLEDNDAFSQFVNGFLITPSETVDNTTLVPGDGSISYFDLNSTISTLTLYYNDSLSYEFLINSVETAKFSRFDHNYAGTEIEARANGGGNTDLSYVQALSGVRTKIQIPDIKDLIADGRVIINKAELIVTLENGTDDDFLPIETLQIVSIDEDGNANFLADFADGIDVFGGILNSDTRTYTFNISRHIHDLLYNTPVDFGMYILATSSSITANRNVIGTETNPISTMKLNITYSEI